LRRVEPDRLKGLAALVRDRLERDAETARLGAAGGRMQELDPQARERPGLGALDRDALLLLQRDEELIAESRSPLIGRGKAEGRR
jgi:hypothetical protein